MVRVCTSQTEVTDTRKRSYIGLLIVGLVLASTGVNAIQSAAPLPQSYAFKDDLLDFSIASYYKGANQSLTFTSNEPGLTVIQPFTYGTDIAAPEGDCIATTVVQQGSLDFVFGLCAGGTKIVKHEIDQENFKEEKLPLTLTLQTELAYPVTCYDMLLTAVFTTTKQPVIVALCRRTDTKVLVLVEVSVGDFKVTASSDIIAEADQPDLKEPAFAIDLSPADSQLDYELVLFDMKPEEFKTSIRWVQRNEKTNPKSFISWVYFGQNVAKQAGKNAPLPVQLNSVKIPDIFLRNRKLFVLARNDNVASKSTKCELNPSPLADGTMEFTCSDLSEIFTNTDPKSFVDIAFSPDVYSSTDEQVEISLTYIEATRFDKKNLYFPSLKAVRPVEKLFFKTNLDLTAKAPVIGVSGREVLIHATDEKANTFLMHWKIEREYLSVVKDTPLKFKSLHARQAPVDRRKLEIIYFSDSKPASLNHFTVQGTEFKISPSDPAFNGKDRVQLSFKVTDGEKTLDPLLSLNIQRDLEKNASLLLNEAYDMYPGTRASIPVSSDRIAGNGAAFSISTSNTNVTASVKYAETIASPKWPSFSTGLDAEITFAKNIGSNTYLVLSGNYLKVFTCNLDGDELKCDSLFENQQTGDFKIIDAKKHDDQVIILFSRTESGKNEPSVGIMAFDLKDGSEAYSPVIYSDLLGMGALGAIRVLNQQVFIDIIARTVQENQKQKIFLAKFKASLRPAQTLKPRDSLPPHVCPTAMFWSPRHEPYLFIESACEGGKKEVLEFYENFDDIKTFALEKIYPMSATSKNQMCITSAAIVIIDFETSEIFGLLRGPSQSSKIAFPFKELGYTAPKSVGCSRYNNFFQVVATSNSDNKDYLITYRTNSANQPNKRIHSIIELGARQGAADAKQWVLPSVNPAYQEIFTMTLGAKWSDTKQAAVVELDVPRIKVNLREYLQSNGEVDVTVTQKILKSSTAVESKFKIKVREISNDLSLVPRVEGQSKITFEKGQKSISLDDSFYIDGLVLNQTLVGEKGPVDKFNLTPRVVMNPGKYLDITTPVKDCRHSQFGVLFCWDAKHVYVWENGKQITSPFNGIYVSNADVIQGYLDPNNTKTNYTYLTGLTNMPGDQEDYLFVIKKGADDVWHYYSTAVSDGITWMRSHLIDDKEGRFAFVAHNPETDSIEVGLYVLDTTPQSFKINFVNNKTRIVKVFPDKISHVQSLYLGQTLEIIYHPRNTRDFFMIGIKSDDLSTLYEEKINFGNTPTTDSYAEGQLKCSSSYSPKKILPPNPAQDNDVKFFCSMTTQRYGSIAASFQLDQTKKNSPKLVDAKVIPNIPGFYPVGLRINNGYTAIIKKVIPGYPKALFPKYLVNETLLVHVIANSDKSPNSHAVIAGSVIYESIKPEDLAAAEFGVDIGIEKNSTVLILTGLNKGATIGTVSAQLNSLTLEIKSADADIKNVKLQIKGLEIEHLIELANHVEYEGTKFLRIVMFAVGIAFLTLICCALSFLCCNRTKAASEIADKEVTFIDEIDRSRFSAAYSASSGSPTKQSA